MTLVAFYSLHHSERVRKAVYCCIDHLSAYFPADECSVQLLMDSVVCESSSLQAAAFQTLCLLLKSGRDTSEWESHLLSAMSSDGRFIDEKRLEGIAPFVGKVADISGWCFVQQHKVVNHEVL